MQHAMLQPLLLWLLDSAGELTCNGMCGALPSQLSLKHAPYTVLTAAAWCAAHPPARAARLQTRISTKQSPKPRNSSPQQHGALRILLPGRPAAEQRLVRRRARARRLQVCDELLPQGPRACARPAPHSAQPGQLLCCQIAGVLSGAAGTRQTCATAVPRLRPPRTALSSAWPAAALPDCSGISWRCSAVRFAQKLPAMCRLVPGA